VFRPGFFFGILFQFANGRKEVPSETSQKNVNDMKEGLLASKLQLHHSSVWNCKRSFSSIWFWIRIWMWFHSGNSSAKNLPAGQKRRRPEPPVRRLTPLHWIRRRMSPEQQALFSDCLSAAV